MPKVYVYDSYDNKFFRYTLRENDPMPYSTDTTLRVREFRGSSKSNVLWTTTAAMEAWNLTRRTYGSGIPVGYAFKRIWEGGHGTTSQHYAGVAFDVGQSSTARKAPQNLQRRCADRGVGLRGAAVDDTHLGYTLTGGTASPRAAARRQATPPCGAAAAAPTC